MTDSHAPAGASQELPTHLGIRVRETIRPNAIMRLTARHMLASQVGTAPVTVQGEADASGLVHALRAVRQRHPAPQYTYTHLLLRLLACTLPAHPEVNAALDEDVLKVYDEVNIGMATTLPDGNLVVPVIRNADSLSLDAIARKASELAHKARSGRIALEDVQGGTFTLSNVGMFEAVRWTTPLLNLPQVAILGTGAIYPVLRLRDEVVVQQPVIGLSLTFDHRALNGVAASRFVQRLADAIADPYDILGLSDLAPHAPRSAIEEKERADGH